MFCKVAIISSLWICINAGLIGNQGGHGPHGGVSQISYTTHHAPSPAYNNYQGNAHHNNFETGYNNNGGGYSLHHHSRPSSYGQGQFSQGGYGSFSSGGIGGFSQGSYDAYNQGGHGGFAFGGNGGYSQGYYPQGSYGPPHQEAEYNDSPNYEYKYGVDDVHTGDKKTQHEVREGEVVRGEYSLVEPDGTIRRVEYTADPHHGFRAIVHKTGQESVAHGGY